MFDKYFFNKSLQNLKNSLFSEGGSFVFLSDEMKAKFTGIQKFLSELKKYETNLEPDAKADFQSLYSTVQKILLSRDRHELGKIQPSELNKLIESVYNAFHANALKKKQTVEEIRQRLEFYGVSPDIRVSASHRPEKGEALAKADLEKLSKSKLLVYFHGTEHPSKSWYKIGGFFRTSYKAGIIEASKYMQNDSKIFLLRLIGAYIGNNVVLGNDVQFDYFYPELIRIEDNVTIGSNTKLWTHDFSLNSFSFAPLTIHSGAVIEDNCFIGPVEIGRNVRVKSHSVVLRDIPERIGVYDNADPKYIDFLVKAVSGSKYTKFVHKAVHAVMRLCKILPYDPLPKDIPLIGRLPLIEKLPAVSIKNKLNAMLGVRIGRNVTFAPRVYIDAVHPELVEIGEGTMIGDGVIFRPYDLNGSPGKIVIGKNCKIGSESIILASEIGDNTQINLRSVVYGSIPANVTAGGVFAKVISKKL